MSAAAEPAVSVVTPAWNAARFIEQTVASVLAQSFGSIELLVADDCSTDDTRAIVARIAAHDGRVRLLAAERNGGAAAARNRALEQARGRYIAFLDSDDYWLPHKLERQLDYMRSAGVALCYSGYRRVDEHDRPVSPVVPVPPTLSYYDLLRRTAIMTSSAVVDRAITGEFRMRDTYYDDFALWVELLGRGFVAHGLPDDLARYRQVAGSLSHNKLHSAYRMWLEYLNVEGLSFVSANWYFMHYAWNAFRKYHRLPPVEEVL